MHPFATFQKQKIKRRLQGPFFPATMQSEQKEFSVSNGRQGKVSRCPDPSKGSQWGGALWKNLGTLKSRGETTWIEVSSD